MHTNTKEHIFKDDIDTEIFWLRYWRIKLLEIEVLKRLKQASPEDDMTKLLMMKKKVDTEKAAIAKEKNTVITPR